MIDVGEVESFLNEFKTKFNIYGILFVDSREKNTQALADLNIIPNDRKKFILELAVNDYCKGPDQDRDFAHKEVWIFGKMIKNKEIYIKISMGDFNNPVICISFHISKHKLSYPFKEI